MDDAANQSPLTVSQVLGAHAEAQMALARSGAGGVTHTPSARPRASAESFTASWDSVSVCIGWTQAD